MKKWLIGIISLLFLFLIGTYLFIPKKISITRTVNANANQAGVFRFLSEEKNWKKWWPGETSEIIDSTTMLEAGKYCFKKTGTHFNSFDFSIKKDKQTFNSLLQLFSINRSDVKIVWSATINTGLNPFSRIGAYFESKELGKRLDSILASMKSHISDVQHIYGFDVKEEKVKIEFMISTKKTFSSYPSTENIYEMLDRVKKYITTRHAREEDYPMLHVTMMDSSNYIAQVAIPIDRQLPDSGIFTSKRMLKNGNILVTQVTGGNATIDSAMEQMDLYISDHQYNNVAIPYQSLITDRTVKPDTSKWVTKIYFPIR